MTTPFAEPANFDAPAFPRTESRWGSRGRLGEREQFLADRAVEGFDAGYAEGLARAEQAARHEIDQALAAQQAATARLEAAAASLAAAAADLARRDEVALAEIEHDVVELAVELAGSIVGRELEVVDEPVREALRRAMALTPDREAVLIRVHPEDLEVAREVTAQQGGVWRHVVEVVGHPDIERGGAVVETGACRIDAQVAPALERMRATVVGAPAGVASNAHHGAPRR